MAYFTIGLSTNSKWLFNLKGDNHEKILASELYESKSSAENGVASVKASAPLDSRYTKLASTHNQYYFVLKGGNGEIIATSETYTTATNRDAAIALVKAQAPTAPTRG
jgi:uncharacterized protein YegP (UPF0339 family)